MSESHFGNVIIDNNFPVIGDGKGRYSVYGTFGDTAMANDRNHLMGEAMRCTQLAMLGNKMKPTNETYKDFLGFMNAFKLSNLDGNPNASNDMVENIMRPLFAYLHKSPIPQLGEFKESMTNREIIVVLTQKWSSNFSL